MESKISEANSQDEIFISVRDILIMAISPRFYSTKVINRHSCVVIQITESSTMITDQT